MKRIVLLAVAAVLLLPGFAQAPLASEPQYYLAAHIDEACSCHLFCPCYFNTKAENDYCNFNNVYTVRKGNYGNVKLDGMKFWLSGNLGANWGTQGKAEAAVATFEPTATQEQIDAVMKIIGKVYPVQWGSVAFEKSTITVTHESPKHVVATREDNTGKVDLKMATSIDGKTPVVIKNLPYFASKSNKGFAMFHSTHHYKGHGLDYSYEGHNGFEIDITVGTPPAAPKKAATEP